MRETQLRLQQQWFRDKPKPIPVLEDEDLPEARDYSPGHVIRCRRLDELDGDSPEDDYFG